MKHTKTIQDLIDKNGFTSYLEIGIVDGDNFDQIKCDLKLGIDPALEVDDDVEAGIAKYKQTSDEFFQTQEGKWDLVFLDGLHHSDQLERDITNAYAALNKVGMILIHDCNPHSEKITRVPRETIEWCGDVYRAVIGFHQAYSDKIKTEYLEDPYGLYVIHKTGRYAVKEGFNLPDLSFEEFLRVKPW